MKKIKVYFTFCLSIFSLGIFSQTNDLSSSPYSFFGLGTEDNGNTGLSNQMSQSGLSWNSEYSYNNLNPSLLSGIKGQLFLLDIGMKTQFNHIQGNNSEDTKNLSTLSHLMFATKINEKTGISLSLLPKTSVGYSLKGEESNIEGSYDTYQTSINGSGGINELKLGIGRNINSNLSLGVDVGLLFGKIEQNESVFVDSDEIRVTEDHHYSGFKLGLGANYRLSEKLKLGTVLDLPISLKANKDRDVSRYYNNELVTSIEKEDNINTQDFKIPLHLGVGINYEPFKNLYLNLDFHQKYWNSTSQSDGIGHYVNQSILNTSLTYSNLDPYSPYLKRIQYSMGFKYDTGYLNVNGQDIDNKSASLGISLPLGMKKSTINLSYTYGIQGSTQSILLKENYNTIFISLNLVDLWYHKIKYD